MKIVLYHKNSTLVDKTLIQTTLKGLLLYFSNKEKALKSIPTANISSIIKTSPWTPLNNKGSLIKKWTNLILKI